MQRKEVNQENQMFRWVNVLNELFVHIVDLSEAIRVEFVTSETEEEEKIFSSIIWKTKNNYMKTSVNSKSYVFLCER